MKAMVLEAIGKPLVARDCQLPTPGSAEVLIEITACAVCRTDLHVIDGELPDARLPLIPGHEIVGKVVAKGATVHNVSLGDRVGVPWLARSCGACHYCTSGRENLCDAAVFTGFHVDGGYATHALAQAAACLTIPDAYDDAHAAPLLCAGLIGYRALRAAGDAERIGLYGFGAAAHIVAQIALAEGRTVFAFTRPGDRAAQDFARALGCVWAGGSDERSRQFLDAAIIFAPVGSLVPRALEVTVKGGIVVLAGIHMSPIPSMPYRLLWGERVLRSVANLTRRDGEEFMKLAARMPIRTHVTCKPLEDANAALQQLRDGVVSGALVLQPR